MDAAIETSDLRKVYAGTPALDGLTLEVPRGCVCGFLGRNGSGKTTTLKVLLGMTRPAAGTARVLGRDVLCEAESIAMRARTGYVAEQRELYPYMTVAQIVRFTRSFYPSWNRELETRYLAAFDLPRDKKIPALSKGMRSRLALLLALCRDPELLLLDEPTDGLDPAAKEQALRAISGFAAAGGRTVFFSSHQLADVEQIADYVVIAERGKVLLSGELDELKSSFRNVRVDFHEEIPPPFLDRSGIWGVRRQGASVSLLASREAERVVADARAAGAKSVETAPANLKDIFLSLVPEA